MPQSTPPTRTHAQTETVSKKEKETQSFKKKGSFFLTVIHLMPSWPWTQSLVGKASLFLNPFFCHYQDRKTKQENRPPSFPSSSIPHWRFPSTFLVHYRNVCWDYVRNICFLLFWSDQGHFSLLFLLCYQLSKHQTTVWSTFVQTADTTCCQRASRSRSCKL